MDSLGLRDINHSRSQTRSPSSTWMDVSQDECDLSSTLSGNISAQSGRSSSCRTSISSLPISVASSAMPFGPDTITPTKNPEEFDQASGQMTPDLERRKWRDSPFRHPSSVRNMQMRDEDDENALGYRKRPRVSRNPSKMSNRSSGSASPSKVRNGRDDLPLGKDLRLKKEFPLVLLHCSILPPTIPIRGNVTDAALLQAVLPEQYRKRCGSLTDRITASLEIQSRGILIPHPKADYELLEERLLESLELTRPRLRLGHYFGDENASGSEGSDSDTQTATFGAACQDCGKRIVQDKVPDRKWEVKVYAANGLMRAGAWSAAWKEMEKVDIEISVWLPEEVRREVEERYSRLAAESHQETDQTNAREREDAELRRREVYGSPGPDPQAKIDGLFDPPHTAQPSQARDTGVSSSQRSKRKPETELLWLVINSLKVLAQDGRNIAIALLGLTIVFYATRAPGLVEQRSNMLGMEAQDIVGAIQNIPRCSADMVATVSPAREAPTTNDVVAGQACTALLDSSAPVSSMIAAAHIDASSVRVEASESPHAEGQSPRYAVEIEWDQRKAVEGRGGMT